MSKMNGLSYDGDKREKDIIAGIIQDFHPDKINPILNSAIAKRSEDLEGIEDQIKELKDNVMAINSDQRANRYLIYADECRKLLTKLDNIRLDSESDRMRRKANVDRINGCSAQLKKSSVDNLKQLLAYVRKLDVHNKNDEFYRKTEEFIRESDGHTITEVDDYRDKLEDLKQEILMD